ncbi:hypothetical protein N0V88_002742 [Collariella sp. IMI 366227]|nr:hypothetical protein N0V88_002742 [Collariella sp. IMI 366227]
MALSPERRALQVCFAGEAKTLFCSKKPQSLPQDVKVADVQYAAKPLREYGTGTQMKLDADGNPVMDENGQPRRGAAVPWAIFSDAETVLVTAKLMTKKMNGLVWFGDIADTIDGGEIIPVDGGEIIPVDGGETIDSGEGALTEKQKKAIISCGTDGGSREVNATITHEAYAQHKALYDSGTYVAGQIVIKVVQNLDWKNANPSPVANGKVNA